MKKFAAAGVLFYLKVLAQLQLKKRSPLVIGVTGTAGKTTALHSLEALFQDTRQCKVAHNANSESGIPLHILGLKLHDYSPLDWLRVVLLAPLQLLTYWEKFDTYIVEMGIDSPHPPKNMGHLLTIIQPDIGIVLNAAPMHSQAFDELVSEQDVEARQRKITRLIAQEKGRLVTQMNKKGTAILNADQPEIAQLGAHTNAKVLTFGWESSATVRVKTHIVSLSGTTFIFEHQGSQAKCVFKNQLLPKHIGHSFAAAICAGVATGLTVEECCQSIADNFSLPPGRSSLIAGRNGSWIIDSSYNSSRKPLIDMLELMQGLEVQKRYVLLGDIRELGLLAQSEHEQVALATAQVAHEAVLVGPLMKEFAYPLLLEHNIPTKWFATAYEAAEFLHKKLQKNDVVLVKASQNTLLLEIAVEKLMQYPQDAESLLPRRGAYWDRQRQQLLPDRK